MTPSDSVPGVAEGCGSHAALVDSHGRRVDYLRLAVTDRCNLRCRYCMPADGNRMFPAAELLSWAELTRLCTVLCEEGLRKIRLTGGEPLLRPGLVNWIGEVAALPQRPEMLLTTNGTLLAGHLDALVASGLRRINLSLDSLWEPTWRSITRRRGLSAVLECVDRILDLGLGLKINVVILPGINDGEILDFVALTRERALTVRFIEPMPFSGTGAEAFSPFPGQMIRARIEEEYDLVALHNERTAVDRLYRIEGHVGRVGIIEGYTRSFCGECSRLRVDPRGRLRTCLYGPPVADLRTVLRGGGSDQDLRQVVRGAVRRRLENGYEAEAARLDRPGSMARIGG